jgi:hypothetical protein
MEFYIPSLFIMILAAAVCFFLIPQFTPMILAIFATLCLVLAMYNHSSLFWNEYKNMQWANTATASMTSPYLLIGLVILLSVGYLILLFSSGKSQSIPMPSMNIPPPSTATNFVTRGIGNGLVNSGVSNLARENNSTRNALESALAKRV